ncbi:DUF1501 domain-containing protein [Flavicella sediminum]|uniref:DUF1501 domain-containing protein n=1 Tax=Flavicella sediminum TaxID=2585141 RepID=UPI00112427FF|nr:DUF1501 domain-containing protein [Flavicella sediminum]
MERRKFIQLSALSSASTLFLNGNQVQAFSKTTLLNTIPSSIIEERAIVLIQLSGGNDGLNTLIPFNQYDEYANLRPTIKIKESGSNGGIPLDNTLALEDQLLLHPSLTAFKSLYDAGKLNIIHNVGYPVINKSHFAARALMFKGGDGTPENANKASGWMARFLHSGYDYANYEDPLGIQLGSKKPSLGFHSEHEHKVDVNLTGQDVSGYYSVISNLGNPTPTNIPSSDYGKNIKFIGDVESTTNAYSERISEVFNAGSNSSVSYPQYDLANQLKTVAKMIKGGSKTKIFLVHIGGFDTHADQVASSADSHLGNHANLLKELGDSIESFQNDLEAMGLAEKIVTATFTEFGRKPIENGNLGTDHGNLGPMFVIGKHINGGINGASADLSGVTKHYDETSMQFDYRQVFTTMISDFLGASENVVTGTEFDDFNGSNKMNLIEESQVANVEHINPTEIKTNQLNIYPNPIEEEVSIKFVSEGIERVHIVLYNLKGGISFKIPQDVVSGINLIPLNIAHLTTGNYVLAIKDSYNRTLNKELVFKR